MRHVLDVRKSLGPPRSTGLHGARRGACPWDHHRNAPRSKPALAGDSPAGATVTRHNELATLRGQGHRPFFSAFFASAPMTGSFSSSFSTALARGSFERNKAWRSGARSRPVFLSRINSMTSPSTESSAEAANAKAHCHFVREKSVVGFGSLRKAVLIFRHSPIASGTARASAIHPRT